MRVVLTCLAASLLLTAVLADGGHGGDERVEELMERTHEGRRSPYGQLRRILGGEAAAWPVVEQAAAAFEPMCRALAESPVADIRDSSDGYIDAVRELRAAVGRRDEAAVRGAFQGLADSCGDCHYDGGVGGDLEHEEEEEREEIEDREERERERRKDRAEREREARKKQAERD